ncbi:Na(+)/H(+) antiporter subunit B [Streptomyces sp. 1331.2]|uniref:Na(+)/H(+) antiporter subunit B n=1 Tax=Streptomyces sp. 1331.2 TaxID=1938835 RepID=UPI000BDCE47B|nr:DUF4040 domain-containing protein [Streptomyces sp. 1331.2]SOB88536.1 Uncharacterized MnhB-related membrane protein [Streptomyces sp. 1331.2]
MTDTLIVIALLLTAVTATAAALTRDPVRQAAVLALLGLCLAALFTVLQAPDVALSQLGVGSAITPLLILLTVRRVRREEHPGERGKGPDRTDRPE